MGRERVVIVGGGVGGLVSAALLAARGVDVTLCEAASTPGGKLRALPVDGVAVDAGPTVFTMRNVFEEIFAKCGANFGDYVALTPATTLARHGWSDGSSLDLFADRAASEDAIGTFAGASAARGYRNFCDEAARIFRIVEGPFMCSPKTGPLGLAQAVGLDRPGDMLAIRPMDNLWKALGKHFPDPRLHQLFGRYATYSGASPFKAPATLMLIAHVEASGVWLVEGGMHRVAEALAVLATRAGAKLKYSARVSEICVETGRATGVVLANGERIEAERIVVNADPAALATGAFGTDARRAVRPVPPKARSLSAMVFLIRGRATGVPLKRHNVFFSDDYRAEFDAIAAGRLAAAPSTYVCAQDRDEGASNQSQERFQIIVNAPANGDTHSYSEEEIDLCQSRMLASMERCGSMLLPDTVSVLAPNDFEELNPSTGGALYGRVSHGFLASFLRQGTRTRIDGLYCVGGSTHPGAGVPMAALSGRLAAECLLSDLASTATSRRAAIAGGTSMRSATTGSTG